MFGWGGVFVAVLPLAGLGLLGFGIRRGVKARRVLENGCLAYAKLVGKEATNTEVNDQTVYKLIFEFTAEDGRPYRAEHRTHLTGNLEDDEEEALVYDPRHPYDSVLVDGLPGGVTIAPDGSYDTGRSVVKLLLLPGLVSAANIIYALS
jgi:hypothetical protein